MATVEELKVKFQRIIGGGGPAAPDRIIEAWRIFGEYQEQARVEKNEKWRGPDPYVTAIIGALTAREYLDPTTTTVGTFAFRIHTDDAIPINRGTTPDLLEGLEDPDYALSALFCRMMVIAAHNPRELDAQFPY